MAARTDPAKWNSLDDLAMLLAEFDMRCEGEDFERACAVLFTLHPLLQVWGHYRLLHELAERLEGHLQVPGMRLALKRTLGATDARLGRYRESIRWLEQALAITTEIEAPEEESLALYLIGWCHSELGNTERVRRSDPACQREPRHGSGQHQPSQLEPRLHGARLAGTRKPARGARGR